MIRIGTAGWAIPRKVADCFPGEGGGLERYAARFNAAEINSTFYRSPRPGTLARWEAATPEGFCFAVKLPKAITHERKLTDCDEPLGRFLGQLGELGPKLGPLLIQLPPSLNFDSRTAGGFFDLLRASFEGLTTCEPRHPTWFTAEADALLIAARIARVAADPARVAQAAEPGGWPGLAYFRLHGSPRMYYSEYPADYLADLAAKLKASGAAETWCIFDNTVSGAAAQNALEISALIR